MYSPTRSANIHAKSSGSDRFNLFFFLFVLLLLIAGLVLTVVSWMDLCTGACAAGHKYRLYGFKFEEIGLAFFAGVIPLHLFSKRFAVLGTAVGIMLAGAVGAEAMFVYAQKYIIKHWCPICLSIAGCVGASFAILLYQYARDLKKNMLQGQKEVIMMSASKGFLFICLMTIGFAFSSFGFSKFNQLQAAENSLKDKIAFGNMESPIEVYVFTDWECPACRHIEPIIEKAAPEITKQAKLIFVDFTVHESSLNFTPYNLSFMLRNKQHYLQLRDALTQLSIKTTEPTEEQVEAAAKALGVAYEPLNYSDVAVGIKYFKHLAKQFGVDATPTVVIVNSELKKGKKLIGANEITAENITKALDSLK